MIIDFDRLICLIDGLLSRKSSNIDLSIRFPMIDSDRCVTSFILSAKKLETTSTSKKQEKFKNGKVRFRLNIDVRKEMEYSRLNAIEYLKTDYVRKRSTEC